MGFEIHIILEATKLKSPVGMLDVTMLALVVVCFALAQAYASMCENLLAPPANGDVAS
jgi:hypothetical protein